MTNEKADLIIHPVRLRILQLLGKSNLTTLDLAERMPDVPKSSLYRHLKKLLDGGMVAVAETHVINGIEEKVYQLVNPAEINAADIEHYSKADHLRVFSAYAATIIQGFQAYLESQENPDLYADRVGYREVRFYANDNDLEALFGPFNQKIMEMMQNAPGKGRRLRKLVFIQHPDVEESENG